MITTIFRWEASSAFFAAIRTKIERQFEGFKEIPSKIHVPSGHGGDGFVSFDEVISLVSGVVASVLDQEPHWLDTERPFHEMGIDSVIAVGLSAEFEDRLGVALDPELAFEHDTVTKISRYLHSLINAG
jgi:acyl carrier protein